MKFCYVGHSFHDKSRSTTFLLDILREVGEVATFTSDPDTDDASKDDELLAQLAGGAFDCYIFFQTEYVAQRLRPLVKKQFIIIPMYDGAVGRSDRFWQQFVGARFLSFSRVHHEHLVSLETRSASFQFFPEQQVVPDRDFEKPQAFFWERRPDQAVNLRVVLQLCQDVGISSLHVHAAPDFARLARTTPRAAGSRAGDMTITRSQWFERREDYEAISRAPLFYFAPRLQEGIGMAALEAMSAGQIVVAPDRPVMNEYISHGTTGILYDPARPKIDLPLDIDTLARISQAARRKVEFGRSDWLADIDRLKSILLDDGRRWSTEDVSSHFMNDLRRAASRRMFDAQARTSERRFVS